MDKSIMAKRRLDGRDFTIDLNPRSKLVTTQAPRCRSTAGRWRSQPVRTSA